MSTDIAGLTFKDDDKLKFFFPAETTSKILVFATNGRFYTIDGAKLPGGRGHGEPIRLYAEMEQETDIVTALNYAGGRKFLVASRHRPRLHRQGRRLPRRPRARASRS